MNKTKKKQGRSIRGNEWLGIFSVLAVTAIVFYNSLSGSFVSLDDTEYVRDNPFVHSLSSGNIKSIFTFFYNGNYHPLTTLVYAVQFKLFHLNAWPYHFISLLLHLANVLLVYFLIVQLSGKTNMALVVALLFGVHPMHVESVAWISELKDVLYSFFYLAGLISYLQYLRQKENRQFILTLVLFLLALLSKSAAITFPLLLLLLDYYKERKWDSKMLLEKIPFAILSGVFILITILSQQSAGAINTLQMPHYTIVQRFFVVSYASVFYILKLFVPVNLSAMYYAPKELPYYYYFSPITIALIAWLVLRAGAIKKQLVFGLLFYLFSIILVVQIIPVGAAIVSERYSYIPYIGLFFIVGSLYSLAVEKKIKMNAFAGQYGGYVVIGIAFVFGVLSYQRNKVWHDDNALFNDIAANNPTSASAQLELANVLNATGNYRLAMVKYNRSIELDSTVAETYFNRGNVYYGQKNIAEALKDYKKATQLKKDYAEAYYNLGTVYANEGNMSEAINNFDRSIAVRPNEYMYNSRATSYYFLQKYEEAIKDYTSSLKINPNLTDAYFNRGLANYAAKRNKEACEDWKMALSMGYQKADEVLNLYCK